MNRTYAIELSDVAEGMVIFHHGKTEKGREHFDTLEAALITIDRLEQNGYEPANGGVHAIRLMMLSTSELARQQTDGGEEAVE